MKVGVVCEGIHDFPALDVLVRELANAAGIADVTCSRLQPNGDATSNAGDGGWTKVAAWCEDHTGRTLDTFLGAPLFEGDEVFDILVIHLDGDIAEKCAEKYAVTLPHPITVASRIRLLADLIDQWLAPKPEYAAKIKVAIPTLMTETWMLAGVSTQNHAWESIAAKELFLAETGYVEGSPKADHYIAKALQLAGKTAQIRQRCSSFDAFAQQIP